MRQRTSFSGAFLNEAIRALIQIAALQRTDHHARSGTNHETDLIVSACLALDDQSARDQRCNPTAGWHGADSPRTAPSQRQTSSNVMVWNGPRPSIEGAYHGRASAITATTREESYGAKNHDDRIGLGEIGLPSARHCWQRKYCRATFFAALAGSGLLPKTCSVPRRIGSLRQRALLGAGDPVAGPYGPHDAAGLCQSLRPRMLPWCRGSGSRAGSRKARSRPVLRIERIELTDRALISSPR